MNREEKGKRSHIYTQTHTDTHTHVCMYISRNQVSSMRGLIETYDDTCNVVEPVIKDVIVTEEYHELCSLTRR